MRTPPLPDLPAPPIKPDARILLKNPHHERAKTHYYAMLRGIDVDCGGHQGAVGVQFDAAQDSSVENVKVTATGAFAGFYGLPDQGAGVVNIEVHGGQYGIYHIANGNPPDGLTSAFGMVIAGAILANQTQSAVYYNGGAPMTLVGFAIETASGAANPAIRIPNGNRTYESTLCLVDGTITLGNSGATAILNTDDPQGGRNLYLRDVYITGADRLVESIPGQPVIRNGATWQRLAEYSFCHPTSYGLAIDTFQSWNLIDGALSQSEIISPADTGAPPADLRSRHVWARLPSVEDSDVYEATLPADGTDVTSQLQGLIEQYDKIYLPPGTYSIGAPGIVLRSDTILFGAGRHLTKLITHAGWLPTAPATVVRTDNDAAAMTYLGDLSIGVNMLNLANAWFTALEWSAGRNSMVHIGRIYASQALPAPVLGSSNGNPIDLLRVTGSGGGRWYFVGGMERTRNDHPAFRHLRVTGAGGINTAEPLWIYGLDMEHARGDTFSEFVNSSNIRIYHLKTEHAGVFSNDELGRNESNPFVTVNNTSNFALFGHGALRAAPGLNRGSFQVLAGSDGILAAGIVPHLTNIAFPFGDTLHDFIDGSFLDYPQSVALYKRGTLTDSAMVHDGVSHGPRP